MAITVGNNFTAVDIDEVWPARYVRRFELLLLLHLAHLVLTQRLNVLAYSKNSGTATGGAFQEWIEDDWMYHWCCRIRSVEHDLRVVIFSTLSPGSNVRLFKIDYLGNETDIGGGTAIRGTPLVITFSLSASDLDPTDGWIRFQIRGTVGASKTDPLEGFVMFERPTDITTADYQTFSLNDSPDGALIPLDSDAFESDVSYNRIAIKRFLDTIETTIKDRTRGCAVAYARDRCPVLGSMFWRGFGPIKFPIASYCTRARMILETYGDGERSAPMAYNAFSANVKQEFQDEMFINDTPQTKTTLTDVTATDPVIVRDIKVSGGSVNNFFIFFRSQRDGEITLSDAFLEFEWKSLGGAKIHGADRVEYWTEGAGYYPNPPHGRHVEISWRDDNNYGKGTEETGYTSYDIDNAGLSFGPNGGIIFDHCLTRFAKLNESVSISLSPAPDFLFSDLIDGGPDGSDDSEKIRVRLFEHSYQLVASVWINEEMDENFNLGQHGVRAGTLTSAMRIRAAATFLNNMAIQGPIVPIMTTCMGYDTFDIDSNFVAIDGQWRWVPMHQQEYQYPNTTYLGNKVAWTTVSAGILPIPLSRSSSRKKSTMLNVEVDWLSIIRSDRDDILQQGVTLRFRFSLLKRTSTTYERIFEIISEVENVRDKIIPQNDVSTHTEWAALTPTTPAGVAGRYVELDRNERNFGLTAGTTSAYAWPTEVMEDAYPFRTHKFQVDVSEWTEDGAEPEEVFINIDVDFHSWETEGEGATTLGGTPGSRLFEASLCIAGCCVSAANYPEE